MKTATIILLTVGGLVLAVALAILLIYIIKKQQMERIRSLQNTDPTPKPKDEHSVSITIPHQPPCPFSDPITNPNPRSGSFTSTNLQENERTQHASTGLDDYLAYATEHGIYLHPHDYLVLQLRCDRSKLAKLVKEDKVFLDKNAPLFPSPTMTEARTLALSIYRRKLSDMLSLEKTIKAAKKRLHDGQGYPSDEFYASTPLPSEDITLEFCAPYIPSVSPLKSAPLNPIITPNPNASSFQLANGTKIPNRDRSDGGGKGMTHSTYYTHLIRHGVLLTEQGEKEFMRQKDPEWKMSSFSMYTLPKGQTAKDWIRTQEASHLNRPS